MALASAQGSSTKWYDFDVIDELGQLHPDTLQEMPAQVLTSNNSYLPSTIVHDENGKGQACFDAHAYAIGKSGPLRTLLVLFKLHEPHTESFMASHRAECAS